jgi:peptidoglycan L-alanyl-D-glutamate endopeptidase CwlK
MSFQLLKQDVLFYQRFLKANGLYTDKLDGSWGPNTNAADIAFTRKTNEIKMQYGSFDARSEENIITLVPKVQVMARKFLAACSALGKDVRIISGTRTYAEQDALYRQGRFGSRPPIVTKARGGQSNHNFGIAWDIGLFENGQYITTDPKYKQLAPLLLRSLTELQWGGNWIRFKDFPHYQFKAVSEDVDDIRALFEKGKAYV